MGNDIDPYFWGKVASETKFVKWTEILELLLKFFPVWRDL
jgi:hypothetical protein